VPCPALFEMDATKNSVGEMLRDALITADHLCVSMQKMSKGKFTKKQFDAQFKMRIEVDSRVIMGLGTTQDEFFASVAEMSQCDACGKLRSGLPKMMTCGNCRCLHYCGEACQREHWKFAHRTMCTKKLFSKDAYRASSFCGKMLSVLSMGVDPNHGIVMNADTSYLFMCFRKHGCTDHVYMPVFQENMLMYIPMPLAWVLYLVPDVSSRAALQNDFSSNNKRVAMGIQTKVEDINDPTKSVFMIKDTFVMLP